MRGTDSVVTDGADDGTETETDAEDLNADVGTEIEECKPEGERVGSWGEFERTPSMSLSEHSDVGEAGDVERERGAKT